MTSSSIFVLLVVEDLSLDVYNENNECMRKASSHHKDLTEVESNVLQENKMMWITDKLKCTCDMCTKRCTTMFHLYDHLKDDHKISEKMIILKLMAIKSNVDCSDADQELVNCSAAAQESVDCSPSDLHVFVPYSTTFRYMY